MVNINLESGHKVLKLIMDWKLISKVFAIFMITLFVFVIVYKDLISDIIRQLLLPTPSPLLSCFTLRLAK